MSFGFYFNSSRCTGCRTCVMACKDYHDHDASSAFRHVIDYEGGTWSELSADPDEQACFQPENIYAYHLSLACNHCGSPACVKVCPTAAMHKDEQGLVWPDQHKCIGCGYCTMACPYHAPFIDQTLKKSSKCDGCRSRLAQEKLPICVEACPLRALDSGHPTSLATLYPYSTHSIPPLPPENATRPNLFISPCPASHLAQISKGHITNRQEW